MKASIFDVKRFAVHDGPGIRTTLFFKGCPLRCAWCHNPESQSFKPERVELIRRLDGKTVSQFHTYGEERDTHDLMDILLRDRHFYEESGGGVTFSGGEPLMQIDALEEILRLSGKEGLHTVVDTCGHAPGDHFTRIMKLTNMFLFDLKNMDPVLHLKYTGVDNRKILANADLLLGNGANLIFRIPVIPGINTVQGELNRFVAYLQERRSGIHEVHLLPYHRIAKNKYQRLNLEMPASKIPEPSFDEMQKLKERFEETGLGIVIGG